MTDEIEALCGRLDTCPPAAGILVCDEVLAGGPSGLLRAVALRYKAKFLLENGPRWALEAVAYLREALPLAEPSAPDLARVLQLLVTAYAFAASPEPASRYADAYNAVAAAHPEPAVRKWAPKVWFNLGLSHALAGQWADAETAYRKAIATAGDDPHWFNPAVVAINLAWTMHEQGRFHDAYTTLTEAKANMPAEVAPNALDEEARCLLAFGRHDSARKLCEQAMADPHTTDALRVEILGTLARIEVATGQPTKAAQTLVDAMQSALRVGSPRLVAMVSDLKLALIGKEAQPHA